MQNVLGLDDPNDRSGTKLVKILSSKAISDCIQDGYLSVKDKPFPCFKENRRMNKLRRKEEPAPATTKICPHCKSEVHIGAKRKSYYNN